MKYYSYRYRTGKDRYSFRVYVGKIMAPNFSEAARRALDVTARRSTPNTPAELISIELED